ncbi:MAG: hypothetical protein M0003_13955, partial [Acidithiobacillus sp.]|nr:hypothetical protein [Acidithiobacillus sp.]
LYLLPPISDFLFFLHHHPSALNADQDRSGQEIWEGGLLRRLRTYRWIASNYRPQNCPTCSANSTTAQCSLTRWAHIGTAAEKGNGNYSNGHP